MELLKTVKSYNIKNMLDRNKITAILFMVFWAGISYASDEVYLDLNTPEYHRFDTGKLQYENKKMDVDDEEDYLKPSFQTMKKMFDEDFYMPKKIKTKKEKKMGKNTVGAQYDTTLNSDSASQTRVIYVKRDLTEKMSVDTSYKSNLTGEMSTQTKGTVSVAPEYKFNKKTSIRNVYSKNLGDNSNKGEVQLRYKPFNDDRMDMNVGAGQKTYDNGQQSSSQVNFGTNIRF